MGKSTTEGKDQIVYRLDAEGHVSYVNSVWDTFAIANDAPELLSSLVVGRPLDAFISDSETRQLVRVLVQRVNDAGRPLHVKFRCDGPHERRTLVLTVIPIEGGVEFRTRPHALESRAAQRLLDRRSVRTAEFLSMCSWCNRVRIDDAWYDVEVAVERLGLLDVPALPSLTHGICPDCAERFMGV